MLGIQALICNAVLFFIIANLDFMPTTCPPLVLQLKGLRNCVSSCFSQPTSICGQGIRQQHF